MAHTSRPLLFPQTHHRRQEGRFAHGAECSPPVTFPLRPPHAPRKRRRHGGPPFYSDVCVSIATPLSVQCSVGLSVGSRTNITKLVLCPVVASTPRRSPVR